MIDTKQAEYPEVDCIDPINTRIRGLLYQRAKDRATSIKWNTNTLVLIYSLFASLVLLTLLGMSTLIVALVAVLGLVIFSLFSWLQTKKLEKQFYQQELHRYMELLSSEAKNNFNGVETPASVDSVELPLTRRELEVLKQVAGGKINKEIASALGTSEMTVKNQISNIFIKLDVNDRTSAVVLALRHGWIKQEYLKQPPSNVIDVA